MAIDVSNWQGRIDWGKVHGAGVRRAYVKWGEYLHSEGRYAVDSYANQNLDGARRHGVQVGVYFFAHPSRPPSESARWFLRSAASQLRVGDLPPALDLELAEGLGWRELNWWKKDWFGAVDAAVGCRAVFYSYYSFWQQMTLYADRPVWGADLRAGFTPPPSWAVHQYSFTGRVDGISGHVDLDRFHWDPVPIKKGVAV